MFKMLLIIAVLLLPLGVVGQSLDSDGILGLEIVPPPANTESFYEISYFVNGILDTTVTTINVLDSTIVLINQGDFAIASIVAVYQLTDTTIFSNAVLTDTVFFDVGTGIGDPIDGAAWK